MLRLILKLEAKLNKCLIKRQIKYGKSFGSTHSFGFVAFNYRYHNSFFNLRDNVPKDIFPQTALSTAQRSDCD